MATSDVLTMVMSRAERKTLRQSLGRGQTIQIFQGTLTHAIVRRGSLHPLRYSDADGVCSWGDCVLPSWTDAGSQARFSVSIASLFSGRPIEELFFAILFLVDSSKTAETAKTYK